MASATAMNKSVEDLVKTFLPANVPPSKARRLKAQFARSIRFHNYGRTNQFAVEERLDGLEEKFQVLCYEDLSDALRERRAELREHPDPWLPDALDLLLHISRDPLSSDRLDALQSNQLQEPTTPPLRWAEIEADDPINHKDKMWRMPDYSDLSSDEDFDDSSSATSPASSKHKDVAAKYHGSPSLPLQDSTTDTADLEIIRKGSRLYSGEAIKDITESQMIRETLLMLEGLPTMLFEFNAGDISISSSVRSEHIDSALLHSVLSKTIDISVAASKIRGWRYQGLRQKFTEVLEDNIASIVHSFDGYLAQCHQDTLERMERGGVSSLLATLEGVQENAHAVIATQNFVARAQSSDAIGLLEILFSEVSRLEMSGCDAQFQVLSNVFARAFTAYSRPLEAWVQHGLLPAAGESFFVERAPDQHQKARLWYGWYSAQSTGPARLPRFLQHLNAVIFGAGKTCAFIQALGEGTTSAVSGEPEVSLCSAIQDALQASQSGLNPFSSALLANLAQYFSMRLSLSTSTLQRALAQRCNLFDSLSAFAHLYLAYSPYATSVIESQVFAALDRGRSTWNDRFMLSDVLEEAYASIVSINFDRITVQSERVSPSKLAAARASVRVLESLAIEYSLPWPIANILSPGSVASYRRVSLMLFQLRRAKYVLERHAFPNLARHLHARVSVEGICMNLLLFTNVVYSHMMDCVVGPLTLKMRQRMTGTIDEMIALHDTYTDELEFACLAARNMKVIRDTLVSLLDLCVGLGLQIGESKEEMDGFALSKVKTQFRKQMNLLVAGLRGVARSGQGGNVGGRGTKARAGEVVDLMELLADSLESAQFKM